MEPSVQITPVPPARLLWFDGLRGVSAIAVVLYHILDAPWISHGYLAVDVFFLLSGYVIAGAYEARLRAGLPIGAFLRQRMARLYPLYLFGIGLGVVRFLYIGRPPVSTLTTLVGSLGFVHLPIPESAAMFPLNGAMWSLALEVIVNLLYAAGGWRLSSRWLVAIVSAAGVLVAVTSLEHGGSNLGAMADGLNIAGGYARVLFGFPLGVLLFRLHRSGVLRRRLPPLLSGGVIMASVAVIYVFPASPPLGVAVDLVAILLLFPLLVAQLILAKQPIGLIGRGCDGLGRLSYPLYAVHKPLIAFVTLAPPLGAATTFGLCVAITIGVALLAHLTVEPIGRRMIRNLAFRPARLRTAG